MIYQRLRHKPAISDPNFFFRMKVAYALIYLLKYSENSDRTVSQLGASLLRKSYQRIDDHAGFVTQRLKNDI